MIKKWIVGVGGALACVALVVMSHGLTTVQAHRADETPAATATEAATATMAATTTSNVQVMHFVLHEDGLKFVPLNRDKDALGDLLVIEDSLYDAANKAVVGHVNADCIRTQLGKQFECSGTTEFADGSGQISWEGPFRDHEAASYLTVTGGTQAYDNVHGEFQVIASETRDEFAPTYQAIVSITKG